MDYSKYHFNYFDVIKRHERIINRPKDWEVKILALIMFFITFCYVFASGVFASENDYEVLDTSSVNGIVIAPNSNHFVSSTNGVTGYVQMEAGYIYEIKYNSSSQSAVRLAVSNSTPILNGTYSFLGEIIGGQSYSYACYNTSDYLYFDWSWDNNQIVVTRYKIPSMDNAVTGLVDNVGVNQIWDTFGNGVDFVGVVVLVAFGVFLVALAIKKVSKGKSEF